MAQAKHDMAGGETIAREARASGLRHIATPSPTLTDVERRRRQLWSISFVLLLVLGGALVVASFWIEALPTEVSQFSQLPLLRFLFLGVLAAFCGYVLEKERHLRRLTRALIDERALTSALTNRLHELDVLSNMGKAINSVQDSSSVLEVILDSALGLLQAGQGAIMLLDPTHQVLNTVCARQSNGEARRVPDEVVVGEGVPGWVAKQRTPILVSQRSNQDLLGQFTPAGSSVVAEMSVPLVHKEELVGVITVHAMTGAPDFTEYDLHALNLFAENAAITITNARLFRAEADHVAELEALDQQRTEFIGTISHELRSPLTAIIGSSKALSRRGQTMDTHHFEEFTHVIERQGERLLRLIEQLMFASRIDAGEYPIVRETVDLVSCVDEVMQAFRGSQLADRIQLVVPRSRSTKVTVLADHHAVCQVVTNLLDNALKYDMSGRPVTLSISAGSGGMGGAAGAAGAAGSGGRTWSVTVTDNGPGIPGDEQAHIFERFRQVRRENRNPQSGVGLGLYIAANLVQAMGGQIWVLSQLGHGTSFTFTLPACLVEGSAGVEGAEGAEGAEGPEGAPIHA